MNKKTIIMMGNSGCGKGTQATILENYFKGIDEDVFHLELGSQFRDLLRSTTYTASVAKKIAKKGGLQPEFLAIKLWAMLFNKYYSPEKNLIIDGTPRRLREAYVLEETLKFYGIERPTVIFLNTSRETATERMMSRKRGDDTDEKRKERLD
jgi:adenylate kinase family enzyme